MSVVAEKSTARSASLGRRADVPLETRQAFGARLARAGLDLLAHKADPAHIVVSLYRPIRGEADTAALFDALARAGFVTALPLTPARGKPLTFHVWRPGDPVTAGPWGIAEPLPSAPVAEPDVLFVPLAAFDRAGFRLGYGAGFYDNALLTLRASKPVLAVGVAFAAQEVARVPCEPHDQRLDAIVTERETIMIERI